MKKRILYILRHFPKEYSGMSTQMYQIYKLTKNSGCFEVKIAKLIKSEEDKHPEVDFYLPFKFNMFKELEKIKQEYNPDIVHFDSFWPQSLAIIKIFKESKKVMSIGGRIFDEYRDYYKYVRTNKFIGKIKGFILMNISKYILKKVDAIIVDGEDIKKHILSNVAIPEEKIYVITNGIDTDKFKYPTIEKEKFDSLLFYGRLSWENGPEDAITIMKKLPEFKSKIIGYGPLENEILEKIQNYKNIKFLGKVPWEKIQEYIKDSDFVILPFKRIGGVSQTVTESMAMGKIVLTKNVGDLHKFIKNGKNAFFFNTTEEAIRIIEELSKDKEKYMKISKEARKTIEEKFSWNQKIKKYIEIYSNL